MIIIHFITGLFFAGFGLAAYLQLRSGGDFPLRKHLPYLAAFGFTCGITYWIDMFTASQSLENIYQVLQQIRMMVQLAAGLLLLRFGWGILSGLTPLPTWTIFIPGVLIVPIAYVITFAATTFITSSPVEIPLDIWTRYLFYLPGSIMAGIGFLREWKVQGNLGYQEASKLMLGAGLAFLFEAFVMGLIVPAAPYGPASYYNYDRVIHNAFTGDASSTLQPLPLTAWLDYESVLEATGLPIDFWRMLSALAVAFFVIRGLGVFETIRKRQVKELQEERDEAQEATIEAQSIARETAERWTEALVNISRKIAELDNVDSILLYIVENARGLLKSDFIGLALINENNTNLELKCYSNERKTEMVDSKIVIKNPTILKTLRRASPYLSQENEPRELIEDVIFFSDKPASTVATVHLNLDNNPIGVLWIAKRGEELYSDTDIIWLECLADQVVIAIQHGLMTSQLQSISIVEERARIAREMHDGIAQILGYLNLQVQTLKSLLAQEKHQKLHIELEYMREAIKTANADVRENILSLRTTLANEKGLVSAVDEYLDEFSIQTSINANFSNELPDDLNLSSIAEVQLVCILQEALTNVRKHALASNVIVVLSKKILDSDKHVFLKVTDNGVGFKLADSNTSFGLKTMRERAQSIKGTFNINSTPGKGTSIECNFPCLKKGKIEQPRRIFSLALRKDEDYQIE